MTDAAESGPTLAGMYCRFKYSHAFLASQRDSIVPAGT
jgi:hypothetical protein